MQMYAVLNEIINFRKWQKVILMFYPQYICQEILSSFVLVYKYCEVVNSYTF